MMYEVVEIISPKNKTFGMMYFENDRELSRYLKGREEWNEGNARYSIIALSLKNPEAYVNMERYGYKEA